MTIVGIGIKSANDCPNRDPKQVNISTVDKTVPSKGTAWKPVCSSTLDFQSKRWHEVNFLIPVTKTDHIKFEFFNNQAWRSGQWH